jgi:hypothetical protein
MIGLAAEANLPVCRILDSRTASMVVSVELVLVARLDRIIMAFGHAVALYRVKACTIERVKLRSEVFIKGV